MEPGVSIQYSQEPATCPYSELAHTIPYLSFYVFKISFDIMLPSFLRVSPPKTCSTCPLVGHVARIYHMPRQSHFAWFDHLNDIC